MEFGRKFVKARERKGLEQKDAAAALDIHNSHLSRIETNKKKPSIELIFKAADLYGVKPAYFFEETDEIKLEDLYTDKNKKFIRDLESLTEEQLKDKYSIVLDGKALSDKELKGIIAYLRSVRSMDE